MRLQKRSISHILVVMLLSISGGCITGTAATGPIKDSETSRDELVRKNEELTTKVSLLQKKVVDLTQRLDETQVKLDFIADKVMRMELTNQGVQESSVIQKPDSQKSSRITRRRESKNSAAFKEKSKGDRIPRNIKEKNKSASAEQPRGVENSTVDADRLYEEALNAYHAQKNQQSIISFQEMITLYPKHVRIPNCYYWIGENYYKLKDFDKARENFEIVLQKFPLSGKVADALLMRGLCLLASGESGKAKVDFQRVIDQFPTSSAAKIAKNKLEKIP